MLLLDDDPYCLGRIAFDCGVPRYDNPYDESPELYGTTYWEAWFDGWDEAASQNESN
jgi:hypothetical protein